MPTMWLFEDACRGTRREIKQGLRHYLPRFADLQQQHSLADLPVVDGLWPR